MSDNNGWISVNERLPEDGQRVLVYAAGPPHVNRARFAMWAPLGDADETPWLTDGGQWVRRDRFSHWQPLLPPERQ